MKGVSTPNSRGFWNRSDPDPESDEVLAQILDRGEMESWEALYALARHDPSLRARIKRIILTVPLPLPHFWLAALANLGEPVEFDIELPDYYTGTTI